MISRRVLITSLLSLPFVRYLKAKPTPKDTHVWRDSTWEERRMEGEKQFSAAFPGLRFIGGDPPEEISSFHIGENGEAHMEYEIEDGEVNEVGQFRNKYSYCGCPRSALREWADDL